MLTRLYIRNYAIIRELDVEWGKGLTIITGETGAGKSIVLGALSLVLGKRADTSVLYNQEGKCIVEAEFATEGFDLSDFFAENDIDRSAVTILRREIAVDGRSRAFINDTPVNLTLLRTLGERLVDVHSQHEVHTLKEADFRTRFLDTCADGGTAYRDFLNVYREWDATRKAFIGLESKHDKDRAEEDYLRFQLQELEELALLEGEQAEIEERVSVLGNAEEIRNTLAMAIAQLSESDQALLDGLRQTKTDIGRLARNYPPALQWSERVETALIDLDDVVSEMGRKLMSIEDDPQELQRLIERMDAINRVLSKHRLHTDAELIALQEELRGKLDGIERSDSELDAIRIKLEELGNDLEKKADVLTLLRQSAADGLGERLSKELHALGMPDARLIFELERSGTISILGRDVIKVNFSANKGQPMQDIAKVASGGELSRLMLVIKAEMARKTMLPTVIFDEIDTGVSGEVADRMGHRISELGRNMQVICITHLPQIAAKGRHHLHVYKESAEGRTTTRLRSLSGNERVFEVARMLSNDSPTDAALEHADQLIREME